MRSLLSCHAYELISGDEFSFDEGVSWVRVETTIDGSLDNYDDNYDILITYRDDNGIPGSLHCDSYQTVLLNRSYGKDTATTSEWLTNFLRNTSLPDDIPPIGRRK